MSRLKQWGREKVSRGFFQVCPDVVDDATHIIEWTHSMESTYPDANLIWKPSPK